MTPRTSSAAWVRGITDMMAAEGLPAAELCAEAGIDLVGYALASGPNLLVGFQHLTRHMAVISDCTTFALDHDARGYWISIAHIGATRPIPRQRVEYALLTLFTLCCWLTRRELRPLAVELTTPQPAATGEAPYHVAFGMLPRFGQAANRFLLAEAD